MGAVFFAAIVFAGFLAALRAAGFSPAAFFFSATGRRIVFVAALARDFADTSRLTAVLPADFAEGRLCADATFLPGIFFDDFELRFAFVFVGGRPKVRLR